MPFYYLGVTFDIENGSNLEIKEDSLNESDSGVGSRDSSNGGFPGNGFTEEDLDAQFKPSETGISIHKGNYLKVVSATFLLGCF